MIMLVDLSAVMRAALGSILDSIYCQYVSLSTADVLKSRIRIDCGQMSGILEFPDGLRIDPFRVQGSIVGPMDLETKDHCEEESDFLYSEASALFGYLRSLGKGHLNPPFAGSHLTNCGSLPEQWAFMEAASIAGVRSPSWTVCSGTSEPSGMLMIANPYDLPIRLGSDDIDVTQLTIVAEAPRGALASCAFCFDTLHLIVLKDGEWSEASLTSRTSDKLLKIIDAFRSRYGIDYGQIHFSFLSEITFWSVMPVIADEHVLTESCHGLLRRIATSAAA